jgi:hypothetical protein
VASCTGLNGLVTVKKEAVAAMLGGATPDPNFQTVATSVINLSTPPMGRDTKGNPVTVLTGRGVLGVAAK